MSRAILITGGAGFIGSHLAEHLIEKGYQVKLYDNLNPQVHGPNAELPEYLRRNSIEFVKGDIIDKDFIDEIFGIEKFDAVIHLAAESHVDRSIKKPLEFIHTNITGTVNLLNSGREASFFLKKSSKPMNCFKSFPSYQLNEGKPSIART